MALTNDEKDVLRALQTRIDTVAFVVSRLAERTFTEDDIESIEGLRQALADCHHGLCVVERLS